MRFTLLTGLVAVASCLPRGLASDVRRFSDGHRIPDQGYCDQPYLVGTKDGNWLCTMTTGAGQEGDGGQHVVAAISQDQGRTWSELIDIEPADGPEASWVVPLITPSGRVYAFYTYNGNISYGATGPYSSRNLAWLSGGKVIDGRMHWSQPELVRYCTHPRQGCSYPDLLEDRGRYYLSATQKTEARIHELSRDLLGDLWRQDSLNTVTRDGIVLDYAAVAPPAAEPEQLSTMPPLPNLTEGKGFSVELWVHADRLARNHILLDSRSNNGTGILVTAATDSTFQLEFSDATGRAKWRTDLAEPTTSPWHHLVFIVDGGPKLIACVLGGTLCDGGSANRPNGYGRFLQTRYLERFSDRKDVASELGNVSGGPSLNIAPVVARFRIYDRPLRVSEAIGNFRAGP